MWVSYAEWQLRIDELCHTLAVEIETTDPNLKNIQLQDIV